MTERPRKQAEPNGEALNQNPSPRDTKEQVWRSWRLSDGMAVVNANEADAALTTAKEQVEAANENGVKLALQEKRYAEEQQRRAEQAESERDTALERVEEVRQIVREAYDDGNPEVCKEAIDRLAALDTDEGE